MKGWTRAAAALFAIAGPGHAKEVQLHEGDLAPPFELRLVDGQKVPLDQLRGQVVVLNFWATWCVPCRKELPLLDAYFRVQKPHGLRVFAMTTEGSVATYKMKPLFQVMAVQSGHVAKGPYRELDAVPTNYVINRAGRIRYMKAGAFDLDTLNAVLVSLLREEPPPATSIGTH